MKKICLSTAFLAPVEYYAKLFQYKQVEIEACDNYIKQTYRNRCFIGATNGPLLLSLPVEKEPGKCLTRDIRLSEHGNWRHQHWYSICSTYNSTPFFEFYEDEFAPFFEKKFDFLFDYNEQLRELICNLLDIHPRISYTTEYIAPENYLGDDFRELIHPKKDYHLVDHEYRDVPYYQLFESKWGFQPNLSIIDLLFNMGPESILILKNSIVTDTSADTFNNPII